MSDWIVAAEGTNLSNLKQIVNDMELPKGTKMRVVMDTSFPWLFDMAGAELAFKPFIPEGMDMVDVWGENGQGIVEMEADPAWLLAVLAFMKAHWLAITIAGVLLYAIIQFIQVVVKLPPIAQTATWVALGALLGVAGLIYFSKYIPRRGT